MGAEEKQKYTIRIHVSIYDALKKYSDDLERSMTKSSTFLLKKEIKEKFKRFPLLDAYSRKKEKTCTVILTEKDDSKIDDIILNEGETYNLNRTDIITSLLLDGLRREGYLDLNKL